MSNPTVGLRIRGGRRRKTQAATTQASRAITVSATIASLYSVGRLGGVVSVRLTRTSPHAGLVAVTVIKAVHRAPFVPRLRQSQPPLLINISNIERAYDTRDSWAAALDRTAVRRRLLALNLQRSADQQLDL